MTCWKIVFLVPTLIQIWPSVSRKRKIRWTRCLLKCMQFQVATMRVLLSLKGFMIEVLAETLTELSIVAKVVDMTSYNVRSHRCHKSWLLPIYEFQTFDRLIQVLRVAKFFLRRKGVNKWANSKLNWWFLRPKKSPKWPETWKIVFDLGPFWYQFRTI